MLDPISRHKSKPPPPYISRILFLVKIAKMGTQLFEIRESFFDIQSMYCQSVLSLLWDLKLRNDYLKSRKGCLKLIDSYLKSRNGYSKLRNIFLKKDSSVPKDHILILNNHSLISNNRSLIWKNSFNPWMSNN